MIGLPAVFYEEIHYFSRAEIHDTIIPFIMENGLTDLSNLLLI